jgi:hypothetical protein
MDLDKQGGQGEIEHCRLIKPLPMNNTAARSTKHKE